MPLLDIQGLNVSIGPTQILKSVSLSVAPGEILGIVGESGSGKSMTLLSAMRLLPNNARTTGRILLDGEDLTAKSERDMCAVRGKRIGMVFQEPMTALNPVQTIGAQVAEMFTLHRTARANEAMSAAEEHLAKVGLTRVPYDRYPHQLSGGQRQRVVVAMATALAPKLVLADEPTTALDVTTQVGILDLLKTLARREGAGLVFVTHDLAVIAGIADRIAIMKGGEIVEEGPAPAIFRTMQHPYSQALRAAATLPPRPTRPPLTATPIAEGKDISVVYRGSGIFSGGKTTRAVDGISVAIAPGEVVGVVGESGSGKSTLARALLGVQPIASGRITIGGDDIANAPRAKLRAIRQHIQVVFQDPYGSLNPRHRVERVISEPLHLLDRPLRKDRRKRVEEMLQRVGLKPSDADKFPHEFSGGQRQRIAIARALILEPKVIVLDEAVSALDVTIRAQIIDLLRDLSDRLGLAYLFITHDLSVVRALADRVLVMQNGKVVEEGPVADVFAAPKHPYTAALLEASPNLEAALKARETKS